MAFNFKDAKQAGYSDAEIADYLGKESNFNVNEARQSGYQDAEIVDHLVKNPPKQNGILNAVKSGINFAAAEKQEIEKTFRQYTPKDGIRLAPQEKISLDYKTGEDFGSVVERKGEFGSDVSSVISPAEKQVIQSELSKTNDPSIQGVLKEQLKRPTSKIDNKLTAREALYSASQPQQLRTQKEGEVLSVPAEYEEAEAILKSNVTDPQLKAIQDEGLKNATFGASDRLIDIGVGSAAAIESTASLADIPIAFLFESAPVTKAVNRYTKNAEARLNNLRSQKDIDMQQAKAEAFANSNVNELAKSIFGEGDFSDELSKTDMSYIYDMYKNNPSAAISTILQSLPSVVAGGILSNVAKKASKTLLSKPISNLTAAGIGEGSVMAGGSFNQSVEAGVDPRKAAQAAVPIGAAGGAIGMLGGRLNKADIDVLAAVGREGIKAKLRDIPISLASEPIEEVLQTIPETTLSNWAQDKPVGENLGSNVIEGAVAGLGMGASGSAIGLSQNNDLTARKVEKFKSLPNENLERLKKTAAALAPNDVPLIEAEIQRRANTPTMERAAETAQREKLGAASDEALLSEINAATEAIPATDLLESDNVSENDATAILATGTSGFTDTEQSGSATDSLLPPSIAEDSGLGTNAATLAQSSESAEVLQTDDTANGALIAPGELQAKMDMGSGAIVSSNGEPYKTELGAQLALKGKRLEGQYEVAPVDGGFSLVKTENVSQTALPQTDNAVGELPNNTLASKEQFADTGKVISNNSNKLNLEAIDKLPSVNNTDGTPTGWKRLQGDNNDSVTLISNDGAKSVFFENTNKKSGTEAMRMNAKADAFAIDNQYIQDLPEPLPQGELVSKPIFKNNTAKTTKTSTANPLFEKNRATIEALAPRMNWGTIGNKRIDDAQGNQIGRSKFVPIDEAMEALRKQGTLSYNGMREAVAKALKGQPLSSAEQRTIDLIADYAEANPDIGAAQPIDAEQAARLQAEYDADETSAFDDLVYGKLDSTQAKIAVTELSDDALDMGLGKEVSSEEFEAWLNAEGTKNDQEISNERVETPTGRNDTRGTPSENRENPQGNSADGNQQQPAPVKTQENSQVRPIVEAITKRRAAATQLGKVKPFDNYLALAKKLMNGEAVKPLNFKLAATAFKADAKLADAFTELFDIAQAPAKEARAETKSAVADYQSAISSAKTLDELQTLAGQIQRDNNLTDKQATDLDDAVFQAQDALESASQPVNLIAWLQDTSKTKLGEYKDYLQSLDKNGFDGAYDIVKNAFLFDDNSGLSQAKKDFIRRMYDVANELKSASLNSADLLGDNSLSQPKTEETPEAAPVKAEVKSVDNESETTYNGVRLYKIKIRNKVEGQPPTEMWAVESNENKARKQRGERAIGGDNLTETLAEAKQEADLMLKLDADKEKAAEAQKQREATEQAEKITLADKKADIDGFGAELNAMQLGKLKETLNKSTSINGVVAPLRDTVRRLIKEGGKPDVKEENVYKGMSRAQYNRANNREQEADERRVREGGKKSVYYITMPDGGMFELGKTAHDFAKHLIDNNQKNDLLGDNTEQTQKSAAQLAKEQVDLEAEVPFTLSAAPAPASKVVTKDMVTADGKVTQAAQDFEAPAPKSERAIWIPNMTRGKLDKLLNKDSLSEQDIEALKDFKYFLINDKQSATDKGFYQELQTSGQKEPAYVLNNKFLLNNIDNKLNQPTKDEVDDDDGNVALFSRNNATKGIPDAIILNELGTAKNNADYELAKSGDVEAATRLAKVLVTDDVIKQLKALSSKSDFIAGVTSVEATGNNALPEAAALLISEKLGVPYDENIVQSSSPKRTGMNGLDRIFNRPMFAGDVVDGAGYIFVDDTITQGGTFAALSAHVKDGGGNVIANVALTGKQYSSKIALSDDALAKVRERFGDLENEFKQATGYDYEGLTASEARYLASGISLNQFRDRITAESQKTASRSDSPDTQNDLDNSKFSRASASGGMTEPFFSLGTGTKLELTKSKSQFSAKVLNKALIKYFGDDWSDSYESVDVPDTLLAYKQEIKVAFGKELRYVSPTSEEFDIFAGVQLPSSPNAIYVNARAETNLTTIAGHELYHTLERARPDLHEWLKPQLKKRLVNFGTYHKNLNKKLQKGEKPYKSDVALSELLADMTGDALSDTQFLQELANADGSKFKGLLNATIRFLNKSILNLINLGSSKYISDVEGLRDSLKKALLAFSNGTPIAESAPKQTDTPAFKKWFGESKVVDSEGKPLVVYHGSPNKFNVFKPKIGTRSMLGSQYDIETKAYFFTDNKSAANEFYRENGEVKEVFLSAKNIDDWTNGLDENLYDYTKSLNILPYRKADYWQLLDDDRVISKIKSLGYDGVKLVEENENDVFESFVVFEPNQIKSSENNNGNFDGNNNDISFSRQGAPQDDIPAETTAQAIQRIGQDKFNRFKVLQDFVVENGVDLSEAADVYLAETLISGRIASRKEDFREGQVEPLIKKTQAADLSMEQIGDFLKMQHAPEANKRARELQGKADATAYGVSDADAQAAMTEFRALPNFAELKQIANEWRAITEETKQIKLDSGLLTPEMAAAWESTYEMYVPVKGGDDAGLSNGTGQGLNVRVRNKQRLGHGLRDEAIIENILRDHEAAISLDENNTVGKALIKFALEAKNDAIITIGKPEKRKVLKQGDSAYMVNYYGSDIATFDNAKDARAYVTDAVLKGSDKAGFDIQKTSDPVRVMLQVSPQLADNEVTVYVAGHAVRIQINDEIAAREYKNMGVEHLNTILSAGREVNNWLSKAYTGYSPDFIFTNPIRDAIQGLITLTGNLGGVTAAKIFANYPIAVKELVKHFRNKGSSALVTEYRMTGGSTGSAYLSDLERIGNDIQASYNEYQGSLATYKSTYEKAITEGKSKKAAHTLASLKAGVAGFKKIPIIGHFLKLMESINAITENALRVATYKTLSENGFSKGKAAAQAKNLMNFNRKGEQSNAAGALYLFFNPAVQGTKLIQEALLTSPHKRQAQALAGGMVLTAFTMAMMALNGDEEDKDKWNKTPDYVKDGNIVFDMFDTQFTITMPYGYRVFWTLGNVMADATQKGADFGKLGIRMASSMFQNFSPIGNPMEGENGLFQLTPTAPKMLLAPGVNEDSFGMPITPKKWNNATPDSQLMNRGTVGSLYDGVASKLNALSGGSKFEAGYVDVSPETLKFWVKSLTGGAGQFALDSINIVKQGAQGVAPQDLKDVPIVRKFVRETGVRDSRAEFWDKKNEADLAADEIGLARKAHDREALMDLRQRNGVLANMSKMSDRMLKMANAKRNAIGQIKLDDTLPLSQKMTLIKELEIEEQKIYDKYINVFNAKVNK